MSYAAEQGILNEQWNAAHMAANVEEQRIRPFMLLRPRIFLDGNKWCALYGDNLQEGVTGFGDTPYEAAKQFDAAWFGTSCA
ncbi:MAG TPA: hypothetical protein ENI80_03375 [Acidiferrobacteraceae bacterium]|nr:hypothetical protein [Acidiferrobacteraceae bacterium]